mmetsp:Transcript_28366/g.34679  ORF Transcript_28366/g.34679 Transcript_28366/m.34679 type:complete len:236 (-) Transcript_28366:113-820(-)
MKPRNQGGSLLRIGWKLLGIALSQVDIRIGHHKELKGPDHQDRDADGTLGATSQGPTSVGEKITQVVGMNTPSCQSHGVKFAFVLRLGLPTKTAHFIGQGVAGATKVEHKGCHITALEMDIRCDAAVTIHSSHCRNKEGVHHQEHTNSPRAHPSWCLLPPNLNQRLDEKETSHEAKYPRLFYPHEVGNHLKKHQHRTKALPGQALSNISTGIPPLDPLSEITLQSTTTGGLAFGK